jgi:hypothetical protein
VSRALGNCSPPPPPPPSPPRILLPLSGQSRTFVFHSGLSQPVREATKNTRYAFYDSCFFALEFVDYDGGFVDYAVPGSYTATNGIIAFYFWGGADRSATGRLEGDLLTVRYSEMQPYEDAVYAWMP